MRASLVHRHKRWIQALIFNQNFDFISRWSELGGGLCSIGVLCMWFSDSFGLGDIGIYNDTVILVKEYTETNHVISQRTPQQDPSFGRKEQAQEAMELLKKVACELLGRKPKT